MSESPRGTQRQLRVVAILSAAERAGLSPLPTIELHTIAYLADALAPVWGLRIIDAQLLKRREGPLSPTFQAEVDHLVGRGIVVPRDVRHVEDQDGRWRLDARYSLNEDFAGPILETAKLFSITHDHIRYVREVVYAVSALGGGGVQQASQVDAAYGDVLIDIGGLVDISGERGGENSTARVAHRFGEVMQSEMKLMDAEMIHFYVRELYKRLNVAA